MQIHITYLYNINIQNRNQPRNKKVDRKEKGIFVMTVR